MTPAPGGRAPALTVDIVAQSNLWDAAVGIDATIRAAIAAAAKALAADLPQAAEVAISLVDDARIRTMNRTWRGRDAPTNVLSFPAAPPPAGPTGPIALGDIAIAYETTAREAADEGKPLENHVSHLVIHGFLHLLGHDHAHEEEAEEMEALERAVLATLGIPDPFPTA